MSPATLAPPPRAPRVISIRPTPPPPIYHEVECGYRPGRGLGLSILAHQLAFLAIVLLTRYGYLGYIQPSIVVKPQLDLTRSTPILVLPTLGGGSEGSGQRGGGEGSAGTISSGLRAQSRRGFAYPGLQAMVSNPPNSTPGIQTILQPSLPDLPRLRRYVPLPNIVQPPPAAAANAAHAEPLVVKSEGLALRPVDAPVAAPKLTLPVAAESKISDLVESKPQLPQRAVPDPVEASEVSGAGKNQSGLLVLNAIPPPPDVTARIPRGEARSVFAVSPGDVTVIAEPAAGTKAGGTASMAAGSGSGADLPRGDTVAEIAGGGGGTDHGQAGSGTGSGGRYGNAHGSGLNSDGAGGGKGRGSGTGPGLGTGSVTGAGSGSGAGSAPGGGGFPGITIQGGRYGNGNTGTMMSKTEPRRQTSYNMNIVSTASSGGGLPDFGVFQNEKVYTVYLDMRADDNHPVPSWTLQYAVLQPAAGGPGSTASRIQGTPTPPYAMLKEVPEFAPELVSKWGRRLIVASAILDTTGKLEQVSVRQSPENQLAGPLVEALRNWIFEPAQIDGRPVALKILLGIRLAASR
jgi:hypothetical protein